jgi:drug/metabolite transporter (DMT)-like permease
MNAAFWGVAAALGWGGADFVARFTGRKLGPDVAALGMLLAGMTGLTAAVLVLGLPPSGTAFGWLLVLASGTATLIAMLLLYDGLARGPVTIVAPIVGAYPVLNIVFSLLRGARPEALQWAAMAIVLAGVAVVARSAGRFESADGLSSAGIRRSIAVALGSALGFGLALDTAQQTIPVFGELQTVWLGRIVSFVLLAALFAVRRRAPHAPAAWWPLLVLQGVMDAGAYVALLMGGHGPGSEIAVVASSSFSVVTVVLARLFLKEAMSLMQWIGVAAIVGGVAALAALGK